MASAIGFPIWRATFPKHTGTGRSDLMLLILCFSFCWISLLWPAWAVQPQLPGPWPGSASACRGASHNRREFDSAGLLGARERASPPREREREREKERREEKEDDEDGQRSMTRQSGAWTGMRQVHSLPQHSQRSTSINLDPLYNIPGGSTPPRLSAGTGWPTLG